MKIDYNLTDWTEIFYYDENSPSGLRWLINSGTKYFGDVAGSKAFNKNKSAKCWDVRYEGKLYKVHRIIWYLFNNKVQTNFVINHIDNNPHNNLINNLELITQDENMRKCSSHTNRKLQINNVTGLTGVSERKIDGKLVGYCASHREFPSGKVINESFSVSKYGEELALLLAKTCRDYFIEIDNKNGANYANIYQ